MSHFHIEELFGELQRKHQEIKFPFPLIDPVCEVPVERHLKLLGQADLLLQDKVTNLFSRMHAIIQQTKKMLTAGLVVVNQKKLLLAFSKNKQAWYLPGGKVDANENVTEALMREINEELNIKLDGSRLKFYTHISAPAFGEKTGIVMEQDCFLYVLHESPSPSAEIYAIQYFTQKEYSSEPVQVPGVVRLFKKLKQDGLID